MRLYTLKTISLILLITLSISLLLAPPFATKPIQDSTEIVIGS